ncbi:sensor histidine kinase [Yinghuangia sp. YIM S09857]|uniref:sensor histidine kinase n=1 Tax=Yinghuangia sp. YIM S09857 TaxID=3436929 RepID=UPI003F529185
MGRIAAAPHTPLVAGVLLGVLAFLETVLRLAGSDGGFGGQEDSWVLLLALITTVPVVLLPAHAVSAAALVTTANFAAMTPFHLLTVAGTAAQLTVVHQLGRQNKRLLAALPVPLFLGYAIAAAPDLGPAERTLTLTLASLTAAAAGAGIARRARNEARVHSAAAQAVADSLLEHAARGERARIARELHDVVAHHISMIAVQAENARLTTAGLPPDGAKRFLAIGDTARAALTEMRRLLGVLREDAGESPGRRPQPALQQLVELVDEARDASGGATRLIVHGRVVPLDPGIELTAYRIVQEALTNARRHAPGAAVDVELRYTQTGIRLRIRDNGPGPRDGGGTVPGALAGHGLVGMRERAAMVGGELSAGAAPGGGFVVEARLPAPGTDGGTA